MTRIFPTGAGHVLRLILIATAMLALSQGSPGSAVAKAYFVSPHGNDANTGDKGQPWRTLQHAVDLTQPGDAIFLKAGSYPEEVHLRTSGSAPHPLTIAGTSGEGVTVQSLVVERGVSHLRLKDFAVKGYRHWGIELSGDNHHIHLSGLLIQGGEAGLRLTVGDSGQAPQFGEVSHITVENCVIRDPLYTAVDGTPGPCNHLTFRGLEVSGAGLPGKQSYGADGLAVERGHHITVENCFIHDNGGDGIDLNSRDRGGGCRALWCGGTRWPATA